MDIGSLVARQLPVLIALAVASVTEILVPLRSQPRLLNGRLATNLTLLAITLSLGMLLNLILAIGAAYVHQHRMSAPRSPRGGLGAAEVPLKR